MAKKSSQDYLSDQIAGRYRGPFPYASPFTTYHEMMTAEYSPQIELDPSNGLSLEYRDTVTGAGTGSVETVSGEHRVSTGTTAGSTAMLTTKERGRYQPGIQALAGHSVRRPVPMTADQEIWWEYGDGEDGVRVGEDSTGAYVQFIAFGTLEPKIYQQNWNRDRMDGSGGSGNRSGINLDLSRQVTFRHPLSHYGVGPVQVAIYTVDAQGFPQYVIAHEFTGRSGQILWGNPKLPLREFASNGTTTDNVELFVGGREFAVLGRYRPNRRKTSDFFTGKTVTSAALVPLISFRKKADRKYTSRSIKVAEASSLVTSDCHVQIIIGGTLTGATFADIDGIPPAETALQSDTSATAITGGCRIGGGTISGGVGARSGVPGSLNIGVDIPDDTIVTLAMIAVGNDATANGSLTLEEEA